MASGLAADQLEGIAATRSLTRSLPLNERRCAERDLPVFFRGGSAYAAEAGWR